MAPHLFIAINNLGNPMNLVVYLSAGNVRMTGYYEESFLYNPISPFATGIQVYPGRGSVKVDKEAS